MTEAIAEFFRNVFGDNVILATIIIAIVPMIELKGAIPFAMSEHLWGSNALATWPALGYSFLGSILIVPVLALVFKPIYNAIKDKKFFRAIVHFFVGGVEEKTDKTNQKTKEKSERAKLWLKILAVFLFVAFPVPLTGVWTGTCFAVLLGLNFWQACAVVISGNAVCGLIVAFVCSIFPNATIILLFVFIGLIVAALLVRTIIFFVRKHKQKQEKIEEKAE